MKLIVGLGNPGRKYEDTRHNIGWMVLDELKRRYGTSEAKSKFQGQVMEAELSGVRSLLLAPHTFMNRSGSSVAAAKNFYKIADEDLLVICDDFQLPLAKLRVRKSGSAGGQNGLADVIRALGHPHFARLRIGIGRPPDNWDPADYVLSRFDQAEQTEIQQAVCQAADAVNLWVSDGIAPCMNQYN
ncbi:MAG: aminoacyl-tRNA hydrolase [Planctomycetales bacterium]|nr:aminoacyl-tRNA hydrolase [Planctomycetales bacterium]NIM09128.1 aminoacyl-tRNA hydrolase [Planctomycetales bacterium]NIN08595.1 aminoacyl-tRNA hydrolase [Planctomycetales bacterium]NIN77721.1 aminoacyl-tRNA hydrolase [Planctomycetales bacterium]NIO34893.1 aminoacyl-tRNA hydrolase [Planctomycetales bacterium]